MYTLHIIIFVLAMILLHPFKDVSRETDTSLNSVKPQEETRQRSINWKKPVSESRVKSHTLNNVVGTAYYEITDFHKVWLDLRLLRK